MKTTLISALALIAVSCQKEKVETPVSAVYECQLNIVDNEPFNNVDIFLAIGDQDYKENLLQGDFFKNLGVINQTENTISYADSLNTGAHIWISSGSDQDNSYQVYIFKNEALIFQEEKHFFDTHFFIK